MGGCYIPPCAYGMNEWFADRVENQGIAVFGTVLQAETATALTAGDTVSAALFTALVTRALAITPISISLACVAFVTDWSYAMATIRISATGHATDP